MKIVFFVVLSFLAIVGVSHIIFEAYYRITRLKDDSVYLLLIPKNDAVDLEFSVRSMVAKARKLKCSNIICLIDGLDDASTKELSLLQKDFSYLKLLKKEDFIKKSGL